jgi:hypothetical protein
MNEKELNLIDEWLSSQRRYKLLDCHRRSWLKHLHGTNLSVWLSVFTSENDDQQAWPSLAHLGRDTGLSRRSVIDAKLWLVEHGWIRVLEGTAADNYNNPTRGASRVQIICVDDPTKGCRICTGDETAPEGGVQKLHRCRFCIYWCKFCTQCYYCFCFCFYGY